jgi:hypothetical protein
MPNFLLLEDQWVGEAVTHARIAYECWVGLLNGKVKIVPESSPNLLGGPYVNAFANYAKKDFLRYVAVLYRGFFKEKKGRRRKKKDADRPGIKTDVAHRIQQWVSEAQIDELTRLAAPLLKLRDKEEHRENPNHPQVWSIQVLPLRPMVGTKEDGFIDPFPVYQILVSIEPTIGLVAFVKSRLETSGSVEPLNENEPEQKRDADSTLPTENA